MDFKFDGVGFRNKSKDKHEDIIRGFFFRFKSGSLRFIQEDKDLIFTPVWVDCNPYKIDQARFYLYGIRDALGY